MLLPGLIVVLHEDVVILTTNEGDNTIDYRVAQHVNVRREEEEMSGFR